MKKSLALTLVGLAVFSVTPILTGAPSAFGAPQAVAPRSVPVKPMKKSVPSLVPVQNVSPLPQLSHSADAVVGPDFLPSSHRGVSVRHAPRPAPQRQAQGVTPVKPHGGIMIKNPRRAPDPRNGVIADVDPDSFPKEAAPASNKQPKAAHKHAHKWSGLSLRIEVLRLNLDEFRKFELEITSEAKVLLFQKIYEFPS